MSDFSKAQRFLDLHRPGAPLLLPNPWDVGSARLFAEIGFRALATTSSGYAGTLGRRDGAVTREEALTHAAALAAAVDLPVSADLEQGFADDPADVAETVRRAASAGLAGCSIEDWSGSAIYERAVAVERVAAAARVARESRSRIVLTARAENHIRGRDDFADTLARLRAFADAGADVVYAPGLTDLKEIEQLVRAVDVPVNVLIRPDGPALPELASVGVARASVGGAFFYVSLAATADAAREWLEQGTHDFWERAIPGIQASERAFS